MPNYSSYFIAKPTHSVKEWVKLCKNITINLLDNGSIVRDVYPIGLRALPHRRTIKGTGKYYHEGRIFGIDHVSPHNILKDLTDNAIDSGNFLRVDHIRTKHNVNIIKKIKKTKVDEPLDSEQKKLHSKWFD